MRFLPTRFPDGWLIQPEPIGDDRGSFARTFCEREFARHGLVARFVQHNVSRSRLRGTLRGLHFQREPHAEEKVVSCASGVMHDVIVDMRRDSPTFGQWQAFELSAANGHALYVPKGFAHGFQALTDDVVTQYLISELYCSAAACGVRHDDPAFGIAWPLAVTAISAKDRSWPAFTA